MRTLRRDSGDRTTYEESQASPDTRENANEDRTIMSRKDIVSFAE